MSDHFYYFLKIYVYECAACIYVYVQPWAHLVPIEVRRACPIPWSWN